MISCSGSSLNKFTELPEHEMMDLPVTHLGTALIAFGYGKVLLVTSLVPQAMFGTTDCS